MSSLRVPALSLLTAVSSNVKYVVSLWSADCESCELQGSAYAHCTRHTCTGFSALHDRKAASTRTQVAITHQLTHASKVVGLFLAKNKKSIKANFKVPHATSNKPKSHITVSAIINIEISNYASRDSSFPKKISTLLILHILFSAGTYPDVSLTRARV